MTVLAGAVASSCHTGSNARLVCNSTAFLVWEQSSAKIQDKQVGKTAGRRPDILVISATGDRMYVISISDPSIKQQVNFFSHRTLCKNTYDAMMK